MHAEYSHYAQTIQPKYDTSTTALQQTLEPDTSPLDKSILYIASTVHMYGRWTGEIDGRFGMENVVVDPAQRARARQCTVPP